MSKKKKEFTSVEEMREFFRREGAKGAKKRSENMSADERSARAKKAVEARWAKKKTTGGVKKKR